MSKNYELIKTYYDKSEWTKEMVYDVVGKSLGITKAEYEEITGTPYDDEPYPQVITGSVYVHEFSLEISGTLYTVTGDQKITDATNGRIEIPVPVDLADQWAAATLAKYEFFNGNTRVDAIPCFENSADGQRKIFCGFRTSGTTDKTYTKVQGAIILKRR